MVSARPLLAQAMEFALLEATIDRGKAIWVPDTIAHKNFGEPFPIHDGNNYKLIYWKNLDGPIVCGTVTFDRNVSGESASIDTCLRSLTVEELNILKMYASIRADLYRHGQLVRPVNAYVSFIPLNTVWGRKVYMVWRSKDLTKYLFGADCEYIFNSNCEMVSKINGHRRIHTYCMDTFDIKKPYAGAGYHDHRKGNQGMLIPDLGGIIYYNTFKFHWNKFALAAKEHLYVLDLTTMQISQFNYPYRPNTKMPVSVMDMNCPLY